MRIIEQGQILEKECKCDRCHTLFAYTPLDLLEVDYMDYMIMACPACYNKIRVPVSPLWEEVREDMLRNKE